MPVSPDSALSRRIPDAPTPTLQTRGLPSTVPDFQRSTVSDISPNPQPGVDPDDALTAADVGTPTSNLVDAQPTIMKAEQHRTTIVIKL